MQDEARGVSALPNDLLELVLREYKCPWRSSPTIMRVARAWLRGCARPRRLVVSSDIFWAPQPIADAALGRLGALGHVRLWCRDMPSCTGARVLTMTASYATGPTRTFACPYDGENSANNPVVDQLRPVGVCRTCDCGIPTSCGLEMSTSNGSSLWTRSVIRCSSTSFCVGQPSGVCLHADEIRWRRYG